MLLLSQPIPTLLWHNACRVRTYGTLHLLPLNQVSNRECWSSGGSYVADWYGLTVPCWWLHQVDAHCRWETFLQVIQGTYSLLAALLGAFEWLHGACQHCGRVTILDVWPACHASLDILFYPPAGILLAGRRHDTNSDVKRLLADV